MEQLETKKSKRNIYVILFVILVSILVMIGLSGVCFYTPNPDLYMKKWIIKRIGELFFNNLTLVMVCIGCIIYTYAKKKFAETYLKKEEVRVLLIVFLVVAGFILSNLGQKEEYMVDGDRKNRFEIIALMLKDYKEQENETITVNSFEVTKMETHFGIGSTKKWTRTKKMYTKTSYYVQLDGQHVTLIDYVDEGHLTNLSRDMGTSEFTVYKNSKMVQSVNGIPLEKFKAETEK